LWALTRSSKEQITIVLDSPLGMLDPFYKEKIIENYLPYAGGNLLLLSKGHEVDQSSFETLNKWIAHTYHVPFDKNTRESIVQS
jgi:DNA sulfur modification protein DndD